MTDFNELAGRYIALWNETDGDARRKGIGEVFTEDAVYIDPLAEAQGQDAIDAVIAGAQGMFPGLVFRLAGPVDTHHDQARFTWELIPGPDAESIVVGFDVAVATEDGRLRSVYGFLDKVPAA
jgi:SnoaL-like domain